MKITVCDPCRVQAGLLVETTRFIRLAHHPELRIDVCPKHYSEWQRKYRGLEKYVPWVYSLKGIKVKPSEVKDLLARTRKVR